MKKILFFLFIVYCFSACDSNTQTTEESVLNKQQETIDSTLTDGEIKSIFHKIANILPFQFYSFKLNGYEYLTGIEYDKKLSPNLKIMRLVKIAGVWQVDKSFIKEIYDYVDILKDYIAEPIPEKYFISEIVIENKPYLFLEFFRPGAGANYTTDYILLDIQTFKEYKLEYWAMSDIGGWTGEFSNKLDSIDINIREKMDELVSKSNFLVKQKPNTYDEPVSLWRAFNSHLYDVENCYKCKYVLVKVNDSFFHSNDNSSASDIFENESCRIIPCFKGMVFYFDKKQSQYYLLWVPKTKYDWIRTVSLKEGNMLLDNIEINMKDGYATIR